MADSKSSRSAGQTLKNFDEMLKRLEPYMPKLGGIIESAPGEWKIVSPPIKSSEYSNDRGYLIG
jgi:hypothetical protein